MLISSMPATPLQKYHQQLDEVLEGIAAALMRNNVITVPSLMKGNAGVALFFAYYHLHTKNETYLQQCNALTNDALSYLQKIEMPAMFGSGFPGITWLLKHLTNLELYPPDSDSMLEDIDEYVFQALPSYLSSHKCDLFYGYIGMGLYFLERNTARQQEAVNMIMQQLETDAIETEHTAYWKTDSGDDINLGLAHGIAGIIKFISHLNKRYPVSERLLQLQEKAANWMMHHAHKTSGISIFPNHAGKYTDSRLAWCYGDLGIAVGLMGVDSLQPFNAELLDHLAARPVTRSYIKYDEELGYFDNCICHGTAGIAYLYHKLYLQTGHEGILEKLNEWIVLMLDNLQKMLAALQRVPARTELILNKLVSCDDHNLLHGISGAGLAIMGMQQTALQRWDHIFLLD